MRIAFISLYQAYPSISGAASVTFNCARLTPGTTLLVQLAELASTEDVDNLRIVSIPYDASSRFKKLLSMPSTIRSIRKELSQFTPDFVVLEGASWAAYLLLIVLALKRNLKHLKLIYHAHNVEYLLRLERGNRLVAYITRLAERRILSNCLKCFAVSEEDRARFAQLYGIQPGLLPNGVDCDAMEPDPHDIEDARHKYGMTDESILFTGLYGYPPNAEAVHFLIEQVIPQLHQLRPNLRLIITGGGPLTHESWLINTGIVSRRELNAILHACRIGLAPIFKGSGTRLKILEYMAAGLPVVTTRKGAEGLNLENGKQTIFAETPKEFKDAVLRILSDQVLSEQLSSHAISLVRANFNWKLLLSHFSDQLEALHNAHPSDV